MDNIDRVNYEVQAQERQLEYKLEGIKRDGDNLIRRIQRVTSVIDRDDLTLMQKAKRLNSLGELQSGGPEYDAKCAAAYVAAEALETLQTAIRLLTDPNATV